MLNKLRIRITRRAFLGEAGAFAVALGLAGCRAEEAPSNEGSGTATDPAQVVVFRNGIVLPVDGAFSEFQALAIRGNRILAVGSDESVMAVADQAAEIIDLRGRTLLPGFIEPHMHFALMAGLGHFPDIGPFKYPTFESTLEALRELGSAASADDWVTARQFDPSLLDPARDLTVRELDEVVPDNPAWILNASGHIAYVNSRTLEIAGITRESQSPGGGEYGRFGDGSPNGILYGPDAFTPVLMKSEQVAEHLKSGVVEAGVGVGALAASHGITTLCDQATGALSGVKDLELYRQMVGSGRMKARIRASLFDQQAADWEGAGIEFGAGDAMLRVVGWKVVTDGSNQGFTGRQREPYLGTDSRGLFYVEPTQLRDKLLKRAGEGWPMVLHGNGDAAIDSILDAVESAQEAGIDVRALRCRIEHCSILHDDQIARIKSLGIGPSFLINHVHYWGHSMRDRIFGPVKVQLLDRCRSVDEAGVKWTMHSDAPVSALGSLHKIRVAVVRDLWKEPETILAPQERVSVEAALRAVTINAAWQCHSESEIGSLEPGKLADFVILEADPRKVAPTDISEIGVSMTWMDGRRVFSA
jgi:predicted amidohydrolase YtcJ